MLTVQNLSVAYGGSRVVREVSLEVPARRVVCLMGRNGVGKTTTLRCLMGLLKPAGGSISLGGEPLDRLPTHRRALAGLGYVPQGRDIFATLAVHENLKSGLIARGRSVADALDRVLELFPVLKTMLKRKGGVLSGGQQQQLAIARALLTEPRILILDEPTEGIQPSIIEEIGQTLQRLRRETDMGILLVEQYLDFARAVAESFYIMDKGQVVASGDIAGLGDDLVRQHLVV